MIKGVLIILMLSGQTTKLDASKPFPDLQTCRSKGAEAIYNLKDKPDIVGMGFTCEPSGVLAEDEVPLGPVVK